MNHSTPTASGRSPVDASGPARQRLTRRLDESAGFRLLVRALTDALLILDEEETIVYVGEGAESVLGVEPGTILGGSLRSLIHPDDLRGLPDRIRTSGGPWEVRFRANGTDRWTSLAATDPSGLSGPGADGDILEHLEGHVLLFVRDIGDERISRDRLDLFRRALDATNNLVVVADAHQDDLPIVFVNQHFLDVTEYERGEVIGQNCRFLQVRPDGTHDDDQAGLRKLRECVSAQEAVHVLVRNYTKRGRPFWNDLFVTPIRGADGDVTHYVGVQNDVSDQVEAAAARDQGAQLLQAIYDTAPLLMGVLERLPDHGLVLRNVNDAAARLLGIDPAEADGRALQDVGVPVSEVSRWRQEVDGCLRQREPCRFRTAYPWSADPETGAVLQFDLTVSPVTDRLVSFVMEDVTARQEVEAQRAELVAAIEQAADAVIITGGHLEEPGPTIHYVNEAFVRMTGYSREEAVGQSPRFMQGPMTDRATLDRLRERLERGLPYHGELVNERKDGTPFLLEIDIMPIRNDRGEIVRFVSTQRDVTERRRLEAEVLGATARAQAEIARDLHDGVGQVLAGTAFHLHGLAQDLTAEGSAYAAQASRAAELVQQAQQQARTLAHGLFPVAVRGDGLLLELERLAEETSATYGIDCRVVCAGSFAIHPDDRAADLYRIAQEAVGNAVRHGKATTVLMCLDLPREGDEPSDGLASLVIEDDGVGISEDDAEGGTGIGVNTMRYRARRIGGTLEVMAQPEGGTRVQVRFPLHAEAVLQKYRTDK